MHSIEGETYDVAFADQVSTLVLKADLDRGWRRRQSGYGFYGLKWIPYKGDWRIKTQLGIYSKFRHALNPGESLFDLGVAPDSPRDLFPDFLLQGGDGLISYALSGRQLVMRVALSHEQPWRPIGKGHFGLYVNRSILCSGKQRFVHELVAFVVFHGPNAVPPPDVRVWCQKFFVPGGQFESNRRRH